MLTACQNAVVLRLDAFDAEHDGELATGFPRVGITTTTWNVGLGLDGLRKAEKLLWQQLRREYGRQVEYCGFVEWTTGRTTRSGGWRRPHIHHLVKGVELNEMSSIAARVSELWRAYAGAWQVQCEPLYTPLGAIAYLVLHHHKREQGPPPGTKHTKRLRPSRGYFRRPIAELRREATEQLRDERLVAELVKVFEVPDGAPTYLVDELIAARIDEARERAQRERPRLVHVREVRLVDRSTGEIHWEFRGVLGLVGPNGRHPLPLDSTVRAAEDASGGAGRQGLHAAAGAA